ncbi:MAG: hypothetical protein ACI9T9_002860 [Oleiphilaceae bacterium]|jgi:hypothetical protein
MNSMTNISGFMRANCLLRAFRAPLSILICLLCLVPAQAQTNASISAQEKIKVSGVKFKESLKLGDADLLLNGAGLRTKFFIDLYISALYLPEKSHDAAAIINADQLMLIQIHVISNLITSENLSRGTAEGFTKSTKNNTKAIQAQIDEFLDAFKAPVTIGDIFEIVYQPGIGVTVLKNRKLAKRIDSGIVFKRALFGIWLSDQPAQQSLKASMLGN